MNRLTVLCRVACRVARRVPRGLTVGLALTSVVLGLVALPAPVLAAKNTEVRRHPGFVDGSGFALLAGEESELVEVNIGPSLLKAISRGAADDPEARGVLSGLLNVNAYIVGLDGNAAAESRATKMIAEIVDALERSGWERLVKVREKTETVNVYIRNNEETIDGLVVLVFDRGDSEVVFANLVGSIDLAKLGDLDGTLDIPGLDAIDKAGEIAPTPHAATPPPKSSGQKKGDPARGDDSSDADSPDDDFGEAP